MCFYEKIGQYCSLVKIYLFAVYPPTYTFAYYVCFSITCIVGILIVQTEWPVQCGNSSYENNRNRYLLGQP